jgi:hypothetical protein
MGAGQDRDGLAQFTVLGQLAVQVGIDTQDVGQGHGIGVIRLRPCHRVTLSVAGHRERDDRVHRPTGRAQRGDQQSPGCFDCHRNRVLSPVAGGGEHLDELSETCRIVGNAFLGDQMSVAVDDGDVVVGLGPVDAAEEFHVGITSDL